MEYVYKTKMVCASEIRFEINDHVITNIRFAGGCPGNLKALSKILNGWTVSQIEEKLLGNTCGARPTAPLPAHKNKHCIGLSEIFLKKAGCF